MSSLSRALMLLAIVASGCVGAEEAPPRGPELRGDELFGEMGEIAPYATDEQRDAFERGREVALRQWSVNDGFGPGFNATSCLACHERPVLGGAAPRYRNTLLVRRTLGDGTQFRVIGGGGVQPHYHLTRGRHDSPRHANLAALRNPTPLFGAGLIAAVSEEAILALQDPEDRDGDGISGRANWETVSLGRFGRKAQISSIERFVGTSLFDHLQITSVPLPGDIHSLLPEPPALGFASDSLGSSSLPFTGWGDQYVFNDADAVPDPEISEDELFDLISFVLLLAAPRPDEPTAASERGRKLFGTTGCADCHVPTLDSPAGPVALYSDLLLHDMGADLADGIIDALATGQEFRTQPLWGVAAVQPYLHDGRADTLDEAIRWHGGEAQPARERYEAMSDADRSMILAFLESLGGRSLRREGVLPPDAPISPAGELGAPLPTLDDAERQAFERGRAAFDRDVRVTEGLGPAFNADSCRACHSQPVIGGAGSLDVNVIRQGIVDATTGTVTIPEGGSMAHRHLTWPERPSVDERADSFEWRQAQALFGIGLIDAIPDEVIVANADPEDADGDGIRGRPHVLEDGRVGRFGWRAEVPSLAEMVREALSQELGVTLPAEPAMTFGDDADDDDVADPEMDPGQLDDLLAFVRGLAPPPRTAHTRAQAEGGAVFDAIGCADCHRTLDLADGTPVALYSDLLLHDVSEPDFVGVGAGDASGRELRTPPLWGLSASAPYMHDGRSATIEDAIAAHAGEASASRGAFGALGWKARARLLVFLGSL